MKPRSNALRHCLRMFCQMVLIVAIGASCVPFSPAAPISSQPDLAPPAVEDNSAVAAPLPIIQRSAAAPVDPATVAPVDTVQESSPLDSAYVRDVDLGDGRRQAMVSQTPINYQAEDGSWQPIDPRFEAIPRGFVNKRNSFEIAAGDRQAALRLRSGDNLIGWEAQAVALTTPDGTEDLLATPLSAEETVTGTLADDERTIRYSHNWTLPDCGRGDHCRSRSSGAKPGLCLSPSPVEHHGQGGRGCGVYPAGHTAPAARPAAVCQPSGSNGRI